MESISEIAPASPQASSPGKGEVLDVINKSSVHADIFVNVCGRSVRVPSTSLPSFLGVQHFLQKELSMYGEHFELFNDRGESICTDGDITVAIESGQVLCANLSTTSVHSIENRREELSHLQWKLLRDQIAGVADKLVQVGHRVQELTEALATSEEEHKTDMKRLKMQTESMVEIAKEAGKQDLAQVVERIEAVSQSVNTERNRRDFMKQTIDQQTQQLRDMLSGDRSTRRSENNALQSSIDEARQAALDEARFRENLEARHVADISWLTERIEALARSQAEKVQDVCEQVKSIAVNVNDSLQDGNRSVLQVQSIVESTQIEVTARFKALEERSLHLDSKVMELGNREVMHFDELQAKQRKMSSVLEQLRIDKIEERGRGLMETRRIVESGEKDEKGKGLMKTRLVNEDKTSASAVEQLGLQAIGSYIPGVAQPLVIELGTHPSKPSELCSQIVGGGDAVELGLCGAASPQAVPGNSFIANSISQRSSLTRSPSPPMPLSRVGQSVAHLGDQQQVVSSGSASTPSLVSRQSFPSPQMVVNAPQRSLSPVSRFRSSAVLVSPTVPSVPCCWAPARGPSVPRHRPTDEMSSVRGSGFS